MTNATKAFIGDFITCLAALLAAYGFSLSGAEVSTTIAFIQVIATGYVLLTRKDSPARVDENPSVAFVKARMNLRRATGTDPVEEAEKVVDARHVDALQRRGGYFDPGTRSPESLQEIIDQRKATEEAAHPPPVRVPRPSRAKGRR